MTYKLKTCIRHKQPFVFNNYIQPVQLPSSCAPAGTYCTVSGWGALREGDFRSDRLQSLAIPILSMADCNASYPDFVNYETMFCAGYLEGGKGMALLYPLHRIISMILTFYVPHVKILASLILEDPSFVTMNCMVLLAGVLAVRGVMLQVFILKFAIILNGSKTR